MAFPTNPTKNLPDDGVNIPRQLILNPGEFPQRAANGIVAAVPSGTAGQVPTYQADGTLAPADASGGGALEFAHVFVAETAINIGAVTTSAAVNIQWTAPNIGSLPSTDDKAAFLAGAFAADATTFSWDGNSDNTLVNILTQGIYEYQLDINVQTAASATLASPGILIASLVDNSNVQDILGGIVSESPSLKVVNTAATQGTTWSIHGIFAAFDAQPLQISLQALTHTINATTAQLAIIKVR